jgi:hypothetical protein
MKRWSIVAAVVTALALAGVALAGTREYKGAIEPDARMKLETLVRHGTIKKVERFTWQNVTVHCSQGPIVADGSIDDPMRVRHHRFNGTLVGPQGAKAHVTGRFRHHGRKAKGTFRIHGDIQDAFTDCHTGRRDWKADRI